mmetsp:Transcript_943/g.1498  ORF Transcript_943/g.1498 Transcript_943/m.1498 type:complete len:293 (+) Transcript_943:482-1360(+)|eukprot:CAMPEP_0203779234 /NCGR_PEP_ID=MMETSP0099_2-20121227/8549_1 /ASSEMBLY_ACC=CAM_ASM_000209 /TAXON_ID=96639 /ORGANISM=" , Strain NY0313808BC1" /LENGTH=292 /DNA_ID=CAMNT_0050679051 /DNA_START=293 /DNA_END=1171 /DNA_ORIENTATION=-
MQVRSVFRDGLHRGRVALVTGGGTGIGFSIAKELQALGCNVVIASRKLDKLEGSCKLLEENRQSGWGDVAYVGCDIRKEDQVEKMVEFVLDRFGRLDYLVNNAGGQFPSPAASISPNGWRTVVDLNLNGTFLTSRAVYNRWMCEHGGSIVNIIACHHNGFPIMAHTGAARAGVKNLTESLALEWASEGVRVNAVAPGIVYSRSAAEHYEKIDSELGANVLEDQAPYIPARRCASTEEISSTVVFLLSPGAAYITGTEVKVDGGFTLYGQGSYTLPEECTNYPEYGTLPKSKL